jgi:hypothetical protein
LEEKVRHLEAKRGSQPPNDSIEDGGALNITQTAPSQDLVVADQRPLSPASLSDGVLDLENSGAFELLEFGETRFDAI